MGEGGKETGESGYAMKEQDPEEEGDDFETVFQGRRASDRERTNSLSLIGGKEG